MPPANRSPNFENSKEVHGTAIECCEEPMAHSTRGTRTNLTTTAKDHLAQSVLEIGTDFLGGLEMAAIDGLSGAEMRETWASHKLIGLLDRRWRLILRHWPASVWLSSHRQLFLSRVSSAFCTIRFRCSLQFFCVALREHVNIDGLLL